MNCGYNTEGCFICWCFKNKKDCCFYNAENGRKECKCGNILPRNQEEFENYSKLKG